MRRYLKQYKVERLNLLNGHYTGTASVHVWAIDEKHAERLGKKELGGDKFNITEVITNDR